MVSGPRSKVFLISGDYASALAFRCFLKVSMSTNLLLYLVLLEYVKLKTTVQIV